MNIEITETHQFSSQKLKIIKIILKTFNNGSIDVIPKYRQGELIPKYLGHNRKTSSHSVLRIKIEKNNKMNRFEIYQMNQSRVR